VFDPHLFDNLAEAYARARRGKQQTDEMRRFHFTLEMNLWDLHAELKDATYRPGPCRHFRIVDPKPRQISAAPFRDRIVHHALCLVIQPLFERKFIYESYANRSGKGTHQAVDRALGYWSNLPPESRDFNLCPKNNPLNRINSRPSSRPCRWCVLLPCSSPLSFVPVTCHLLSLHISRLASLSPKKNTGLVEATGVFLLWPAKHPNTN